MLLSCVATVHAAPFDYDGDSYSDPSTVEVGDTLNWLSKIDNKDTIIERSFGIPGQHLVPGRYKDDETMPAILDSEGTWKMSDDSSVSFGEEDSLYFGGADFNGDSLTDYAYSTQVCRKKKAKLHVRLNGESTSTSFNNGGGAYYKFFYDADNDGRDDFCTLKPIRRKKTLTPRFRAICKSALTGGGVKRFTLGRVNGQPHPLKVTGSPDLLVVPQSRKTKTNLRFYNQNGTLQRKTSISQSGTLVIGNFISTASEQAAVVTDQQRGYVYDPLQDATATMDFPDGVPYDEINIVHFEDNEDCFCTSKMIQRDGQCSVSLSEPKNGSEPTKIIIPDNCSNPPKNLSSNDGFKCIASATRGGSVVCLLPYQFTWKPHSSVTDHHNNTFACNKNDTHFDDVQLVLKSGERINLSYSGCHNYVATVDGPIGRQHFRNENYTWQSIRNKVVRIEMSKGSQTSCLSF